MSQNRVCLQGRLTADPEMRSTNSGVAVANFRLAVDRDFKDKETGERQTDYFNMTAWRHSAEFVCKYFQKGDMMVVDGKLQNSTYTDKEGNNRVSTNIVVENAYFCSNGRSGSEGGFSNRKQAGSSTASSDQEAPATGGFTDVTESESESVLPF